MKKKSIVTRVYLNFFLFLVIISILFILINRVTRWNIAPRIFNNNINAINKTSFRIWENSALSTVKIIGEQVTESLYNDDYYNASILVEVLQKNSNIAFSYIVNEKGIVFIEGNSGKENVGKRLKEDFLLKLSSSDETVTKYINNDLFCISHPIVFGSKILGKLVIGFKANQIQKILKDAQQNNRDVFTEFHDKMNSLLLYSLLIICLLMLYTVYIFHKKISKPLIKLSENAEFIAKGNYMIPEVENSHYEFEQLNRSFLTMTKEIYNREKELIDAYENIESEVKIRTRELQKAKDELKQKAFYDSLTGLPNRALCYDRLEMAIKRSHRNNTLMSVMFLDLDKFKKINDSLGHDKGDLLLVETSKRLVECARETDTVCRLGGDEFVIILNDVESRETLSVVAGRIIEKISEPYHLDEHSISTSTSIGITVCPDDGAEIDKLMKNADIAMYKAKSILRGTYEFYTKEYEESVNYRIYLENRIKKSVVEKSFIPYFQPIFNIKENKVVGLETLCRWDDDGEIYKPAKFLEILEDIGLVHEMTLDIMEASVSFIKDTDKILSDNLWISVNISPNSLMDEKMVAEYLAVVEKYGFPKERIIFELTENILIKDFDKVAPVLNFIKENKVKIALDDFGSGYSSLNYLNTLMPDKIKLDKSFVNSLGKRNSPNQICLSILNLAKDMDMDIIAEGVETWDQLHILKSMGYKYFQGYYFSKPAKMEETVEIINIMNRRPYSMIYSK